MRIVKCLRCGSEYEMPDILPKDQKVIMEDCPNCRHIDKMMKDMGLP